MKVLYIIKNNFFLFLSKLRHFLALLLILPLVIGFSYGLMYEKMLNPEVELKILNLYTCYSESSTKEKDDVKTILSKPNYNFIKEQELSKNDINNLLSKNTDALGIILEGDNLTLVNYGSETLEKSILKDGLNKASYSTGNAVSQSISTKNVDVEPTLSSKPKMFLSVFSGIAFFIAINLGSQFLKRRENTLIKRLNSCNICKNELFIGECLFTLIISFLISITFSLIAYKLILNMDINLAKLMFSSFIQAIVISSLYGFIIGVLRKDRTLQLIFIPIMFIILFLGGTFFPYDTLIPSKSLVLLFNPTINISRVFEMTLLNKPFSSIYENIIFLSILSSVLMLIGYLKFSLEEV